MKGLPGAGAQRCNGDIMLSLPATLTRHNFTLKIFYDLLRFFWFLYDLFCILCCVMVMSCCQSPQPWLTQFCPEDRDFFWLGALLQSVSKLSQNMFKLPATLTGHNFALRINMTWFSLEKKIKRILKFPSPCNQPSLMGETVRWCIPEKKDQKNMKLCLQLSLLEGCCPC